MPSSHIEDAQVFFRADDSCEQIEILTLLAPNAWSRNLEVVLNNMSPSLALQHCRAEAQPTSRCYYDVWLIRAMRLPPTIAAPTQLAALFNEIEEEITVLRACRDYYLLLFRNGCAALNA